MPPTVIPTDFAPFFDYVTAALVAARVVPAASLVIVTALPPERVPHYSADTDILLRGGPERTNEGTATGGGTLDTHSIATLYVIPRSRLELDEAVSAKSLLTDASLGHYRLRAACRSVIQMEWPEDSVFNAAGVMPMRWVSTGEPVADPKSQGWVWSIIEVELEYPVLLNPRNPP